MRNTVDTKPRHWMIMLIVVSLSLLWSLGVPMLASADNSNSICVLKIVAEANVVSILTNDPTNFGLAILVPEADNVNVPILCNSLGSLALGVANQADHDINVAVQIFTHQGGTAICSKGPVLLAVNGGTGMTFADCP
jgi:hypothetical protein